MRYKVFGFMPPCVSPVLDDPRIQHLHTVGKADLIEAAAHPVA